MKLLLTGATGFLGSHLLRQFLLQGHNVIILKRTFSNTWRINDLLNEIKCYNTNEKETQKAFLDNPNLDAIIHVAASYGKNGNISSLLKTNLLFSIELLEYALKYNIKNFCYANSKLDKYTSNYSLSKHQFAEWGQYLSKKDNLKFIDIKLEYMYGKDDDENKFIPWIIKTFRENKPYINLTLGEQKRDFIYIDDVVSAFMTILDNISSNDFNDFEIGVGKTVAIRDLIENLKSRFNADTKLNFGALPYREYETMESKANIENLKKLGWMPKINLQSGLARLI